MILALHILKIAGLVLLYLLLFILVVLCLLLFMPFSYILKGEKKDELLYINARLSFMGFFLRASAGWDKKEKFNYSIKLLGIELNKIFNKKSQEVSDEAEKTEKTEPIVSGEAEKTEQTASGEIKKTEQTALVEAKEAEQTASGEAEKTETKPKKTIAERMEELQQQIKGIYEDIVTLPQQVKAKAAELKENAEKRAAFFEEKRALLEDERFMEALFKCWEEFKKLINKIKPVKGCANIRAGFEDPYYTGCMAAMYSILCQEAQEKIRLTTDFEKAVIEGNLFYSGRFSLFVLLYFVYRVYFKDDFKYIKEHLE